VKIFTKRRNKLFYVTENAEWIITWIGRYLVNWLNENSGFKASSITSYKNIRNNILHFGSRNIYFPDGFKKIHKSNKVIVTWFHGTDEDLQFINALPEGSRYADIIHTSCEISKSQIIKWGGEPDKIEVIPFGIDLNYFKPVSHIQKMELRKQHGIPESMIVIGSFQKDGNGWEEGFDPKLIKGPDIFCEVVEKLSMNYPIFVLLSAPARGYVKKRLKERKIPFKHIYYENHLDVSTLYHLLDFYIIASRVEGGPASVLESLATGVPVLSTKVGMANDIIKSGYNGILVDIDNVDSLVNFSEELIENESLRFNLRKNGLHTIEKYDWNNIAKEYYERMYKKFL
jgi:glycosyltransferase involved in cell wall biosynthesis